MAIINIDVTNEATTTILCVNTNMAYTVTLGHGDVDILERSGLSYLPVDTNGTRRC